MLVKTCVLYTIMVTGSIWEKVVFGKLALRAGLLLGGRFSFVVIALHTAYVAALFTGSLPPAEQMAVALAAYAAYVVNAGQFL